MVNAPYSGNAVRSAHFAVRPSVPGVNRDHFTPDPEPDPFNPQPTPPPDQAGSILTGDQSEAEMSGQPNLASQPIHHWYAGQPSVPSGVPYGRAQQAMQERMMEDHSETNTVPDSVRLHKHATQGLAYQWLIGRPPQNAGVSPGTDLEYLVAGRNSYDATNEPNEVYAGDAPNVGRYRLGVKTTEFGLYDSPLGKFGQDAQLHPFTGLSPALPQAKPQPAATNPRNAPSSGTAHWLPAPFAQIPSRFGLPSETALSDFATVSEGTPSEFVGTGEEF